MLIFIVCAGIVGPLAGMGLLGRWIHGLPIPCIVGSVGWRWQVGRVRIGRAHGRSGRGRRQVGLGLLLHHGRGRRHILALACALRIGGSILRLHGSGIQGRRPSLRACWILLGIGVGARTRQDRSRGVGAVGQRCWWSEFSKGLRDAVLHSLAECWEGCRGGGEGVLGGGGDIGEGALSLHRDHHLWSQTDRTGRRYELMSSGA